MPISRLVLGLVLLSYLPVHAGSHSSVISNLGRTLVSAEPNVIDAGKYPVNYGEYARNRPDWVRRQDSHENIVLLHEMEKSEGAIYEFQMLCYEDTGNKKYYRYRTTVTLQKNADETGFHVFMEKGRHPDRREIVKNAMFDLKIHKIQDYVQLYGAANTTQTIELIVIPVTKGLGITIHNRTSGHEIHCN